MRHIAGIEQIRRWWRRWPDANVGVVTGAVSGLVVLDVDPRHGGGDSLAILEGVHGVIPLTVESFTGGGGQHLYFRHPGTVVPCRSIAPGLDIKGDGGLVVSPPSTHISGRLYGWESGCAPGEAPLADLPSWLQSLAQGPSPVTGIGARVVHQEPGNSADPAAIAVTIGGRTVGYLSGPDSARHRQAIATAIDRTGEASCIAFIVGGWEREHGDVGPFGVRLHLGAFVE